jgi:SAM-dependent methyltransferase
VLLSRVAYALEDRLPVTVAAARRGNDRLLLARERWANRSYPAPGHPHSSRYVENHHRLVTDVLADDALLARLRAGGGLPDAYGRGFDERVVEYPWLRAQGPFGRLLDAGSTLNHAHVLDAFQPQTDGLSIVTLAPERLSYPARGISYLYADIRDLPLRDALFDTVVCASTLEHVGMDNRVYGSPEERASDAATESARALRELERVLAPGGRILLTVPYGAREDMGWQRQFDRQDLEALLASAAAREVTTTVFAYSPAGWQLSDLAAASAARYHHCEPGDDLPPDRAVAARAVALCLLAY